MNKQQRDYAATLRRRALRRALWLHFCEGCTVVLGTVVMLSVAHSFGAL